MKAEPQTLRLNGGLDARSLSAQFARDQRIQIRDAEQKRAHDMNALRQRQWWKDDLFNTSDLWHKPYGVAFDLIDMHGCKKAFADDQIGARRREPDSGALFIHPEMSGGKTMFRFFILRHVPEPGGTGSAHFISQRT